MKTKSVLIISLTPVFSEPRVLRQANLFYQNGMNVIIAGYEGKDKKINHYKFIDLNPKSNLTIKDIKSSASENNISSKLPFPFDNIYKAFKYKKEHKFLKYLPNFLDPFIFLKFFYDNFFLRPIGRLKYERKRLRTFILIFFSDHKKNYLNRYWDENRYGKIYDLLKDIRVDFIFTHDYFTTPIAYKLAKKNNSKYFVDVHEHALSQKNSTDFFSNLKIKIFQNSYIKNIENEFYIKSNGISTVSDGLNSILRDQYPKIKNLITVRSTPFYEKHEPKILNSESRIEMLYHGILAPGRGLETYIKIMNFLPEKYYLKIRGSGPSDYINSLNQLINSFNLSKKIKIVEPVDFNKIVFEANKSDIGLLIMKNTGMQKTINLSNKFFEYIMSGIMLCVSNYPDMAKIVNENSLGLLIDDDQNDPKKIAELISKISYEKINFFKINSIKTAKILSWENESKKLLKFINN